MAIYKYPTKKGNRYYYKFCLNYKQFLKRGFLTRKDAELAEAKEKINPESNIKFLEVVELYLRKQKKLLKITTYRALCFLVDQNFSFFFKVYFSRISIWHVEKWLQDLDGKNMSFDRKNTLIRKLKYIFEFAQKDLNKFNSVIYYLIPFKDDSIQIGGRSSKRYITAEEFQKFLSAIDEEYYRMLFLLGFLAGCRIGEIRALEVAAVKDGGIYIYREVTSKLGSGSFVLLKPKSVNSNRFIPLSEEYNMRLLKFIADNKLKEHDFLFFGSKSKKIPIGENTINLHLQKYIRLSGIPKFIFHDFRHSVASFLADSGENLNNVSLFLGHANKEVTEKYYLVQRDETKKDMAEKLYKNLKNEK